MQIYENLVMAMHGFSVVNSQGHWFLRQDKSKLVVSKVFYDKNQFIAWCNSGQGARYLLRSFKAILHPEDYQEVKEAFFEEMGLL